METALVIVESPAKAKTIARTLGRGYQVLPSMGHLRDLPRDSLGIDIEGGFDASYAILSNKQKIVDGLARAVERAARIVLALDRDREGEAIAWHIRNLFEIPPERCLRVVFNEITPRAIREAFASPRPIDMRKVEAQQARRALDRIVGYKLSPLIWEKVLKGLSAGRVQSVAVRLIVEREKEIRAFTPRRYWTIRVRLRAPSGEIVGAELRTIGGRAADLPSREAAETVARALRGGKARIASLVAREKEELPPPPFTTSRLQQEASTRLSFSPQRTMRIAQQLYEGIEIPEEGSVGLITYVRTDSVRMAEEAVTEIREFIRREFGPAYLPPSPPLHANRTGAQEAHEAIRPTEIRRTPASLEGILSPVQAKLYGLIWRQAVASQMPGARYRTTRAEIEIGEHGLAATGREAVFDGFRRILPLDRAEMTDLPPLQEGQLLDAIEVIPAEHFTQPPKRYTEASLIRALEKEGIGRPSTYATILGTIRDRNYVELRQRQFHATELGILVTDRLVRYFPRLLDVGFTRAMEESLDRIEAGERGRVEVLRTFWKEFAADLQRAWREMPSLSEEREANGELCPRCGKGLVYVWTRSGRFLGCSGYPACSFSRSVDAEGRPLRDLPTAHRCGRCGSPMLLRRGRNGAYLACSRSPDCPFTLSADADGNPVLPPKDTEPCEACGGIMILKVGPHGPFLACARYPDCRTTRPLRRNVPPRPLPGKVCEKCGSPLAIRVGRRGPFVACMGFPRCRNTRPLGPDDLPEEVPAEPPQDRPPIAPRRREAPPPRPARVRGSRNRQEPRNSKVKARRRS